MGVNSTLLNMENNTYKIRSLADKIPPLIAPHLYSTLLRKSLLKAIH